MTLINRPVLSKRGKMGTDSRDQLVLPHSEFLEIIIIAKYGNASLSFSQSAILGKISYRF